MVSMFFFMLLSILIIITLIFISDKLLACISCSSSSGEFSCYFIWACFIVSPFWLPLCVYFFVLGRASMTHEFGRVALYSRCLVRPSGSVSLITWAGCSRNVPLHLCCPPTVIESWLPLSHLCRGLTLRLAYCEAVLTQCASPSASADHMK